MAAYEDITTNAAVSRWDVQEILKSKLCLDWKGPNQVAHTVDKRKAQLEREGWYIDFMKNKKYKKKKN